jgi:hypothetical protein
MLVEILSDAFKSKGQPRGIIKFHEGLNSVLGSASANNSIGKSTFLLIIDFCFGGETYSKQDVMDHIGDHSICFSFEFEGKQYYFQRVFSRPNVVDVCDSRYSFEKTIGIDDFRHFLCEKYLGSVKSLSFREAVSRFFRISSKKNDVAEHPLELSSQSMEHSIVVLEKLFGLYNSIELLKIQKDEAEKKKKAYSAAKKFKFIPNVVTSKTKMKENLRKISELEEQIDDLLKSSGSTFSQMELEQNNIISEIYSLLQQKRRYLKKLISKYHVILKNINGNASIAENDLRELSIYFPSINIKHIEEVESFHKKLSNILTSEIKQEASVLDTLIKSTVGEITLLENELSVSGNPVIIPKKIIEQCSDIKEQISTLKAQNEVYENSEKFKNEVKEVSQKLNASERIILDEIQKTLNEKMLEYNSFISNGISEAPIINFIDGKKYTFFTPLDKGTGTAYKNLIILDMAILSLTDLPALIHDSSVFKNIGDAPIEKIMELYYRSKKQIFIAFDKDAAYTPITREILNKTTVLRLNDNGDELFGLSWAKKGINDEH